MTSWKARHAGGWNRAQGTFTGILMNDIHACDFNCFLYFFFSMALWTVEAKRVLESSDDVDACDDVMVFGGMALWVVIKRVAMKVVLEILDDFNACDDLNVFDSEALWVVVIEIVLKMVSNFGLLR